MGRNAVIGIVAAAVIGIAALTLARSNDDEAITTPETPAPETQATAEATPALDDATIVAIFDAANTADIETGALAAQRGGSAEVRAFGAMLARDHEAVRRQGRDLAARLQVTPTPPADDPSARQHAAAMAELRALEGEAFDRAFLRHEVNFHLGVIDAVTTTLLPAIDNAELRALVEKVAPAFDAHMRAARQLETTLGGAPASP